MGWGKLQELPSLFAERLQSAHKGEIVGPIRSGVGFHILKVNDMRGADQTISVTEVNARHILLKPSPMMTDEQARAKLEAAAAEIKSGKRASRLSPKKFRRIPAQRCKAGNWVGHHPIFTIQPSVMH